MTTRWLTALAVLLWAPYAQAQGAFDGPWGITMDCPDAGAAKGYSIYFMMQVTNGLVSGQHGEKGAPGSWILTGTIASDGTAQLRADGLTGNNKAYNLGGVGGGQPLTFGISGRLERERGVGTRSEGRSCRVTFVRHSKSGNGDWALGRWYGARFDRGSRSAITSVGMRLDVEKLPDGSYRCTILTEAAPNSPGTTPCFIDDSSLNVTTITGASRYHLTRNGPNLSGEGEFFGKTQNWKADVSFGRNPR